ncbi:MAG: hypothetical protein KG003_15625 [Bacteroidetes bacterium]|nr:hypothetical protein [Bacteroidota bacterium]
MENRNKYLKAFILSVALISISFDCNDKYAQTQNAVSDSLTAVTYNNRATYLYIMREYKLNKIKKDSIIYYMNMANKLNPNNHIFIENTIKYCIGLGEYEMAKNVIVKTEKNIYFDLYHAYCNYMLGEPGYLSEMCQIYYVSKNYDSSSNNIAWISSIIAASYCSNLDSSRSLLNKYNKLHITPLIDFKSFRLDNNSKIVPF